MKSKLCYFVNSAWYFELHWLDRACAALHAGYEVYVIARFDDDDLMRRLNEKGLICFDSKIKETSLNPVFFLLDCHRAFNILDSISPDILHSITIKPGIISGLWSNLRNKKLIYSFVGLGRVFDSKNILFKFLRYFIIMLYRKLFSRVDCKIVFEHKEDQRKIIEFLGISEDATVVIDGAGIDTRFFSYSDECNHPKVKVLFASRLLWSKGLADLVKAKRILKLKGIDFELSVAGIPVTGDKDAIDIKNIDEWQRSGDIIWLGQRSDIRDLIRISNIVALPSTYPEGVPRILLESGAIGRPCLVYNIGGCKSLIKDEFNGYAVEPGNIELLSSRLEKLILDSEERHRMGKNARQNIEGKYTSEIIINETLRVYGDTK